MAETSGRTKTRTLLTFFAIVDIVVVLCGVLFWLNHWPGGIPMLVLGLSMAVYIWIGFIIYRCIVGRDTTMPSSYKTFRILAYVFLALSGSCLFMGTLFAICHWPGWKVLLMTGTVNAVLTVFATIMAVVKKKKSQLIVQ